MIRLIPLANVSGQPAWFNAEKVTQAWQRDDGSVVITLAHGGYIVTTTEEWERIKDEIEREG